MFSANSLSFNLVCCVQSKSTNKASLNEEKKIMHVKLTLYWVHFPDENTPHYHYLCDLI